MIYGGNNSPATCHLTLPPKGLTTLSPAKSSIDATRDVDLRPSTIDNRSTLTMAKSTTAFTGGKLSLKGDKKKPKKKTKSSKHHGKGDESRATPSGSAGAAGGGGRRYHPDDDDSGGGVDEDHRAKTTNSHNDNSSSSDDEELTAAEKRSRKFKKQRERKELEQVVRYVTVCGIIRVHRVIIIL